ncbi:hypothetical protein ZWY2020_000537 [Hordeum vulgare]|nr:hypothetical protein ZWY2020_000537 [Hordeum vulgare]
MTVADHRDAAVTDHQDAATVDLEPHDAAPVGTLDTQTPHTPQIRTDDAYGGGKCSASSLNNDRLLRPLPPPAPPAASANLIERGLVDAPDS